MTGPSPPSDEALEDAAIRLSCLALAVDHYPHCSETDIIEVAQDFYDWATAAPKRFRSFLGIVFEQDSPAPLPYYMEITNMAESINLTDTEQVTVAIEANDTKGFPVVDALTWTSDNPDSVGLVVAADSGSALFVAGNPGNATVTATDGKLSEIYAVTVGTSAAATFKSTIGAVEQQPAAVPTPPVATVTTDPPVASDPSTVPGPGAVAGLPAQQG